MAVIKYWYGIDEKILKNVFLRTSKEGDENQQYAVIECSHYVFDNEREMSECA